MDFSKAKSLLESSTISINNDTKFKLYGLYKQATEGVCSISTPGLTDFIARSKWTSWSSLGKMTKQDAQKEYIKIVEQLLPNNVRPLAKVESQSEHILLIKKSPLHWEMIFNRPDKYNAITLEMYKRITEIFDEASEDEQLVLLSFTGNGKFYSSGTDLADPAKMFGSTTDDVDILIEAAKNRLKIFIEKFITFPKILIAFVNGPAIGISVSTLGLFDGVYASSSSTFSLPFIRTAQSAEGCSSFVFPNLMGSLHAKEVLLFDQKLTAEEAYQRGLVTRVFQENLFEREKEKICQHILSLPRGSLLANKELIQKWNKQTLIQVNQGELDTLQERWSTEEFAHAIMTFINGRKKSKL